MKSTAFKKRISLFLNILIGAAVAVWAYFLVMEYTALQVSGPAMAFLGYLSRLFLFVLFLVVAILYITLTRNSAVSNFTPLEGTGEREEILYQLENIRAEIRGKKAPDPQPELPVPARARKSLLEAITELSVAPAMDAAWKAIFGFLRVETGSTRVSLLLPVSPGGVFAIAFSAGVDRNASQPAGQDKPSEMVRKTGKRLFVTSIETHPELSRPNRPQYTRSSFMVLPVLIPGGSVAAILCITEKSGNGGIYTTDELETAEALASVLGARMADSLK